MINKTTFKNLILVENKAYKDSRGYFKELIREKVLKKKFPFTVMSFSKKNVIRGLHLQTKNSQGKFISVIKGKIFDVVVDLRKKSKTFGKYYKIVLSSENCKSIYIPPGFLHGFLCLDKDNYVVYGCTNYRDKDSETSVRWNDPDLKIKWGIKKPVLSEKDKNSMSFKNFKI